MLLLELYILQSGLSNNLGLTVCSVSELHSQASVLFACVRFSFGLYVALFGIENFYFLYPHVSLISTFRSSEIVSNAFGRICIEVCSERT